MISRLQVLFLSLLTWALITQCHTNDNEHIDGKQLSIIYCQSCHAYPEPEELNKETWKEVVLPRMGQMLGQYSSKIIGDSLTTLNKKLYPTSPIITDKEWQALQEFYINTAPINLHYKPQPIDTSDFIFKPIIPNIKFNPPSTTFIEIQNNLLLMGDAHTESFLMLNPNGEVRNVANVKEGLVHSHFYDNSFWLTVMGNFSPSDERNGFIIELPTNKKKPAIIIDSLNRPVHSLHCDFNNDGQIEIITSEFGKWEGQLSLIQKIENKYSKSILINQTGPIASDTIDLNQDGKPDIITLFGQGNESFTALINQGGLDFEFKEIIKLPPTYGSSSFELFDYNNDGKKDIIYTAGDNADYNPILKPYHGIYVYLNKGNAEFEKSIFIPLNGAYDAKVSDFDNDGDYDIAAISFFPDYKQNKEEGFVFFENNNNKNFIRKSFKNAHLGRWIRMDTDDIDNDGDIDIVLGSLAFEVVDDQESLSNKWMANGIPYLILENELFNK